MPRAAGATPAPAAGQRTSKAVRRLFIVAFIFHFVYAASIFDIYFRSPIVHGMEPHSIPLDPPAERLILFVADGLRADRFFELDEEGKTRAPFLRGLLETDARWGVSHTRVPTESRPGHVALIAGLYEDVSAVTKGWQENPVEFDSLFNVSSHTFAFGSPDILPMFAKGAQGARVSMHMYDAHAENFAMDATHLDTWVFDRVGEMLTRAKDDAELDARLRAPRTVIFCHLLGLDTTGHSRLPHSPEYYRNLRLVDAGIANMVSQLREFYKDDGRTAFVFTADHGMSDRGAHGDGDPDNTQTPLVVWGAGVKRPLPLPAGQVAPGHTELSAPWGLSHLERRDVNQADVAPLMASLIGTPFPRNNVGIVPVDLLNVSEAYQAHALLTNARQVFAQYRVKAAQKAATEVLFRPYEPLRDENDAHIEAHVTALIEQGRYDEANAVSASLIARSLGGLYYFQTYDWLFLRTIVTLGYLGWMINSFLVVVRSLAEQPVGAQLERDKEGGADAKAPLLTPVRIAALGVQALASAYLVWTSADLLYHAYVAFPVYFWCGIFEGRETISRHVMPYVRSGSAVLTALGYLAALEVLVASYFRREILAGVFLVLPLYPAWSGRMVGRKDGPLWACFGATCWATGVFMLLPVVKEDYLPAVYAGGLFVVVIGVGYLLFMSTRDKETVALHAHLRGVLMTQTAIAASTLAVVYSTARSLEAHEGLPRVNQVVTWAFFIGSMLVPFVSHRPQQYFVDRIMVVFLGFATPLLIVSVSYELLFYVCFSLNVVFWIALEIRLSSADLVLEETPVASSPPATARRALRWSDVRVAFLFLFYVNAAFFGTGNVASVASFTVSSVYRLVTVFSPFLMGGLLLVKIVMPFFILSAVLGVLCTFVGVPTTSLFLLILSLTDVLTLNFFFLVRDEGSWLEIGMSISHFIIASGFIVFLTFLFYISHALLGVVITPRLTADTKKRS